MAEGGPIADCLLSVTQDDKADWLFTTHLKTLLGSAADSETGRSNCTYELKIRHPSFHSAHFERWSFLSHLAKLDCFTFVGLT